MLLHVLTASWILLGEMAPYLLFGFLVAGLLSVFVSPEWVEEHLGRRGWMQVGKASLFGVPLPLCSCGVLPVGASLRRHGASKGATTAFLLSTPQTGVDSIAVTWALLGPVVAVIRPLAAFGTGILGGLLVEAVDRDDSPPAEADTSCGETCCSPTAREPALIRALRYGFITLPRDIGRALLLGLILSGVIAAFLGPQHVEAVFGGGWLPYIVAMVVGIPLYVCATASTPIAASLIGAGLSPGAALVFLISGPATNVASLTTLTRVLGSKAVALYLATVAVGSLATGVLVDALIGERALFGSTAAAMESLHLHGEGAAGFQFGFKGVCAVVLLGVLAGAFWPRSTDTATEESAEAEHLDLVVDGMRCNGCVDSIARGLQSLEGVDGVDVSLKNGAVTVFGSELDPAVLCSEVEALGFDCRLSA